MRYALCAALLVAATGVEAGGKPGPCVRFARSWDDALTEARALNLPLVIHRHGFYWGPCKAVHRSVLTNREYIEFASEHTVEVICMQDLDRALAEKDPQVKTYRAKDRYGDKSEYLVKFPGLTVDDLRDLAESKALEYMEGRLMPATVIVDPHSLEKIGGIPRSMRMPREFIKAIAPHAKALKVKYGRGVDRKVWDAVDAGGVEIDLLLGEGRIPEALAVHRLIAARVVRQPDIVKRKVQACLEIILEDAGKRLDALEKEIAGGHRNRVSRELARLARVLQETPLADRARKLAAGPAPKDNWTGTNSA